MTKTTTHVPFGPRTTGPLIDEAVIIGLHGREAARMFKNVFRRNFPEGSLKRLLSAIPAAVRP